MYFDLRFNLNDMKGDELCGGRSMFARFTKQLCREEDGQGITEYGAIIAFVSVLIFFVFGFANGSFAQSLQQCCSSMIGQLNRINNSVAAINGT